MNLLDYRPAIHRKFGGGKLLALLLLLVSGPLFAQSKSVSGIVKSSQGEPLVCVTVLIEGTTQGTSTDADGAFTLTATPDDVLLFSYVGYRSERTKIGARTHLEIQLTEDQNLMDEVVVVGYGTQKKRDVVGAIEQIKGEEITSRPNPNVVRSMQGQIPGLTLEFRDGKPSHGATLAIRGATNSIGSGGSALVMVDGVEGDLTTINPEDIASVTVLKDASSCAIYGARGSFGVILVTTKNAEAGQFTVKYDGAVSFHSRTVEPKLVTNSVEWTDQFLESYFNCYGYKPSSINNLFPYSDEWYEELKRRAADPSAEQWRVNDQGRYEYFGNTDWDDLMYRDVALSHQHNVTMTGGSDRIKFLLSGRYFHQDGIYNSDSDWYWQANGRAKITARIKDWWTIENSLDFVRRKYKQPMAYSGKMSFQRQMEHQGYPMTLPFNPDGSYTDAAVCIGYAAFQTGLSYQENLKFDMTETLVNTFHIIPEVLDFQVDFSYVFNNSQRNRKENIYEYGLGPEITGSRAATDSYEEQHYNFDYWKNNGFATFTPRLGEDHSLKIMAGYNVEWKSYRGTSIYRRGLIRDDKPNFSLMDGDYYEVRDTGSYIWSYVGFFGRANYSYKGRYLAEISARYDGSSKFPTNQRWGFFPSASVGWRISEESFMEGARSWLDNLKVRASAGTLGNGSVSPYAYMQTMTISQSSILINGGKVAQTLAPNPIPDGLTWERATTYDVGLDVDLLGNRLSFVGDYYRRYTTDMYTVGKTLPAVFGKPSPKGNYADMKTEGWELSLGWRDSFQLGGREFSYGVKAMVWDSRSFITKYNNATKMLTDYYEGMEIGEIWGFHVAGLFESKEEASTWPDQSSFFRINRNGNQFQAGDIKFADLDDSGAIDYGKNTADDPGDMRVIGNSTPRYSYGLNLNASYCGVGISLFFQGVGKRDWYPSINTGYFWGKYNRPYSFMLEAHTGDNIWTEENRNTNALWPRMTGYLTTDAQGVLSKAANDRFLVDASYCRLKNITIDYTFPKRILKKIGLQGLRVYVTGENLFTWSPITKWTDNFDPEVIQAGDTDFNSANSYANGDQADGYSYPMLKSVTVGVNITF